MVTASLLRGIPPGLMIVVQVMSVLLILAAMAFSWIVARKQQAHAAIREGRWASTMRHIVEGLHLMGNPRTIGLTAAISFLYVALQFVSVFALMKADGLDLSIW